MNRIDVHHHFIPPAYEDVSKASNGDPTGWVPVKWTIQGSLDLMKLLNTHTAILSMTAPGPELLEGKAAADFCRATNEYASQLCKRHPGQIGFFAYLPPLIGNKKAALEEIAYALDVLKADGIGLFTRYGTGNYYLGHKEFQWLWDELDKREAVVHVHPTGSVDATPVNKALPQPVIDYPHETTRAAVDLLITNTVKDHPNVKIILSHTGGTLPYLAHRAANLTYDTGLSDKSPEEFLEEASSFYFDLALSATPLTLDLSLKFAKPDHVLFGTDFPYAPKKTIERYANALDHYEMDEETRYSVSRGAAVKLFPRFRDFIDNKK
ncbi:hypothetical protein M426DRAFT_8035 [Hypoxylon sp. CI-4A]|nr:hypothetical protein M426DRAFT_8035 [Hypoxylon sp. CI-4A]